MVFSVYMHVNKINGKRYVGITQKEDPEQRWLNGKGYFKNKHFSNSITKYGWENFEHIIVDTFLTREQACNLERKLIKKYKTQNRKLGYNITDGGDFFHHSEESKRLMSEHRKGKGLHTFSEEHKRKMRENHKGGANKKRVLCVETEEVYESINDASRATGINKKQISNCCRKVPHYNTANGYHWIFV